MGASYHCGLLPRARYADWAAFVEQSPSGSIYSTPAYLEALSAVTGGRFEVLAVEKGDQIVGGVALYEEDTPGGVRVSPRLLLYYNSPVLVGLDSRHPYRETSEHLKVLTELESWLRSAGYGRLSLKCVPGLSDLRPMISGGWAVRPTWSYVVPVSDIDATWDRIEQNLRRLVRRAGKEGIVVSEDDDFQSFFRLHASTMVRKNHRTYLPRDRFERYFRLLHEQGLATLFHARMPDGAAAASALVLLGRHPVSHTVSAAADATLQGLGTNALLRWESFKALHERGFAGVDLTDASLNAVTRFKAQLGGDLVMSLEIDAPRSARFRAWELGHGAWARTRAVPGAVARRLQRVGSGRP